MGNLISAIVGQLSDKLDELVAAARKRALLFSLIAFSGVCGFVALMGAIAVWLAEIYDWKIALFSIAGALFLIAISTFAYLQYGGEAKKALESKEEDKNPVAAIDQSTLISAGISLIPVLLKHRRLSAFAGLGLVALAALDERARHASQTKQPVKRVQRLAAPQDRGRDPRAAYRRRSLPRSAPRTTLH